jgi:hypothetical protein
MNDLLFFIGYSIEHGIFKEGKVFREFLLIAGGEDNVIVQIKGNMTFNDAKKFSEHSMKEHGTDLR